VCRMEFDTKGYILLHDVHTICPHHMPTPYAHIIYPHHIPTSYTHIIYPHHKPTPYTHIICPQQSGTSSFAAASSMRAASDLVLDRVIRRCVRALRTLRATI
jgi:hypothetical protein